MTTTPLTDQQLGDIDTRAQAASKGPWGVYQYGGDSLIEIVADLEDTGCGYRGRREICRFEDEPLDNDPTHREWTAEEDWAQVQADAEFVAHAPEDVRALLEEVRRLRDELAELKASNDPRLRGLLVKADKERDLYVLWSTVCDMPGGVFSRETALEYGFPRSKVDHADEHGSSSRIGDGAWDDKGWVAEQRGWLRRDRIGEYAVEYLHGDQRAAYALLEPFDDDPAVSSAP
jgi:hypothetical protein